MSKWNDQCRWVGCTNDPDTPVLTDEYGPVFYFCDKHAEKRVAATEEAHYRDE